MPDPADVGSRAGHWLALLRDGTEEERQFARTELGLILEARGLLDDAIQAYERNVEAGVTDRRPYERLAALARARGDLPAEARALRALADLLAPPPQPSGRALTPRPPPLRGANIGSADVPAAGEGDMLPLPLGEGEPPTVLPLSAPERGLGGEVVPWVGGEVVSWVRGDVRPSRRRLAIVLTVLALPVLILLIGALVVQPERPVEAPFAPVPASPTALMSVASPTAVEIRLAADIPVVQPSPTATPSPSLTALPTLTPTPLPARCADADLRFPETRDSEAAVRAAYRDYLARQGVTLGAGDAIFTRNAEAYAARHAEVVAGWIGVTLQRERRGVPVFSLADFVASDVIVATGPGEYQFRATISPRGWSEIRAWPATTCEGAFIQNPANARWVEAMEASVGDITWALPTPQPAR